MKIFKIVFITTLCFIASIVSSYGQKANKSLEWLDAYNPCWNSQSKNSSESMPCGGGNIGMNVWVENDELLFYLSQSGAFDENNVFPKFGRVRVSLSPNPFKDASFNQKLVLRDGYVEILADKQGRKTRIKIWADVFQPVVSVEVKADEPMEIQATYENWRNEQHEWGTTGEWWASLAYRDAPMKAVIQPDSVNFIADKVVWYHRNRNNTIFDVTVKQQGLESMKQKMWNPLKNLTFGGTMWGKGFVRDKTVSGKYIDTSFKGYRIRSKVASKNQMINIALYTEQTPDINLWKKHLNETIDNYTLTSKKARIKTLQWWNNFWNRSHIVINADSADTKSESWQVGRNYQLFRYQLACNAYGKLPTKFNGGLFTYDPSLIDKKYTFTPDHRNWGGGTHTAQNQRLVYWPMLKNGDGDMLKPQLDFYKNALINAELRVKKYWGHEGACFTEQIDFFGLPMAASYGWNRPAELEEGIQFNQWIDYEWDTVLEFCKMALDWHYYTGADIREYLPLIEKCLMFFDKHYQYLASKRSSRSLTGDGKLVMYPGTGCETYKVAYNSSCTIAALKSVIQSLLQLPDSYLQAQKKEYFKSFLNRVPNLPFREIKGHKTIAPALAWERIFNVEIPQLYPVFPWGLYGVGLPDLDIAVNTWRYGIDQVSQHGYISWHQDAIFCARLGLTSEARDITLKKMKDSQRRYPTFWGPGHDWTPDHNWGGSGMIGVQEMLVQTVGEKIYLFPAWPKEWNVDFKMNLPQNTIIEGSLKNGKLERVMVTPVSRQKDLVIM